MNICKIILPALSLSLVAIAGFSGCASIVSKTTYPVSIKSFPPGEEFVVKNESGSTIHSGKTPQVVMLKAGDGFFDGATYKVEFEAGNVLVIDSSLDPWYFGNILFGGLIGMVIVDPATGAMWKLPESTETAYVYSERKTSKPKTTSKSTSKPKSKAKR